MTRINVVPVDTLCDQHLLAEWRELPRMNGFAEKCVDGTIPRCYVLGTGHMKFFLDKGIFLEHRHRELTNELLRRGFNLIDRSQFKMSDRFGRNDYVPTIQALQLNEERIRRRMPKTPRWSK